MPTYLAIAYRWGWLNGHQYLIYCGEDRTKAEALSRAEQADRGGKYGCAVYEVSAAGTEQKLIGYFGATMHNEPAPFYNPRIDYFNQLGYILHTYAQGHAYVPDPENNEFMQLIKVKKPPEFILHEVARQAQLAEELRRGFNAPANTDVLAVGAGPKETLLPCPFCGSTNLILRTYPAQSDVAAFTTHITCNAGATPNWHRCGAAQSITRETYAKSREAGIKAWNIRFSPQEYCDGQAD